MFQFLELFIKTMTFRSNNISQLQALEEIGTLTNHTHYTYPLIEMSRMENRVKKITKFRYAKLP